MKPTLTMRPIIITTHYRRPQYTSRLLEALQRAYTSKLMDLADVPVVIHQDWNSDHAAKCTEVKDQIIGFTQWFADNVEIPALTEEELDGPNPKTMKLLRYYNHNPRLGIDLSKLWIIEQAFQEYPDRNMFIFLEDDTIPDPMFIKWAMNMGEKYYLDEKVFSMCGYRKQSEEDCFSAWRQQETKWHLTSDEKEHPFNTGIEEPGFCPWGWASWPHKYFEVFAKGGEKYKADTGEEANGRFDWWLHTTPNLTKVVPIVALVQSVGGEDGEHTPSPEWHTANEYNQYGVWTIEEDIRNSTGAYEQGG